MAVEVGKGVLIVDVDTKGLLRQLATTETETKSRFTRMGTTARTAMGLGLAAVGVGIFEVGKKAISLEADFSKTMNQMQAATGVGAAGMKKLQDLAITMGQKTVFSASDAASAMLELAKGGIKPAQIQAGALKGTLTLAAAGNLQMADAANIAVRAMGAFNLHGKDMGKIAAALAGAANASSADVHDLSFALAQAGASAHQVGFSIQETTAALAAFSNAGINGTDAGTSLKTMLMRLQPQTTKAATAMSQVGLFSKKTGSAFVDAQGNFKSLAQISGILHDKLGNLTKAQQQQALTSIFGSDATRAATVLMDQGAKGIKKFEKATNDQHAATKLANAGMKGTAGAIEQLRGSLETVALQFGMLIKPAVVIGLKAITAGVNDVGKVFSHLQSKGVGGNIGKTMSEIIHIFKAMLPTIHELIDHGIAVLGPLFHDLGQVINKQFLPTFQKVLPILEPIGKFILNVLGEAIIGVIAGVIRAVKGVVEVVTGVIKVVDGLIHGRWSEVWAGLKSIVGGVLNAIIGLFEVWWNIGILGIFKHGVAAILGLFSKDFLKTLPGLVKNGLSSALNGLDDVTTFVMKKLGSLLLKGLKAVGKVFRDWGKGLGRDALQIWSDVGKFFGRGLKVIYNSFLFYIHTYTAIWRFAWQLVERVVKDAFTTVDFIVVSAFRGLMDAFKAVGGLLRGAWRAIWTPIVETMRGTWDVIASLFHDGEKTVSGLWSGMWSKIRGLWQHFGFQMKSFLKDLWETIYLQILFKFDAIKVFFAHIWDVYRKLFLRVIEQIRLILNDGWANIHDKVVSVWHNIKSFFSRLFGHDIPSVFKSGVSAIGKIWDTLKRIALAPVAFVVNTVYDNGIRKVVNAIPGVPDLPRISVPKFASGGPVNGGVAGRDSVAAMLMPGEHVWTSREVAAAGGHAAMEWMRRSVLRDGHREGVAHFARGGPVGQGAGNRDDRVYWGGKPISRIFAAQLLLAQHLGHQRYGVIQGSWQPATSYSGTTHTGAGVADLSPGSFLTQYWMRRVAMAAWARNIPGAHSSGFGAHVHSVSRLDPGVSASARAQIGDYLRGGDGLGGRDYGPRPSVLPNLGSMLKGFGPLVVSGGSAGGGGGLSFLNPMALLGNVGSYFSHLGHFGVWGKMMIGMAKSLFSSLKSFVAKKMAAVFRNIGSAAAGAFAGTGPGISGGTQALVNAVAKGYGWGSGSEWLSLYKLINAESTWNPTAQNPHSTAFGLFQFLDSTWRTVGGHKTADPRLQAIYGLRYIKNKYGDPNAAWAHEQSHNWFDSGGLATSAGLIAKGTTKPERVLSPDQTMAFERLVDYLVRAPRVSSRGGDLRARRNQRVEFVITNWEKGMGYMRGIAAEEIDADATFWRAAR